MVVGFLTVSFGASAVMDGVNLYASLYMPFIRPWLCIFLHTLINSFAGSFGLTKDIVTASITAIAMMILALVWHNKNK